MKDLRGTDLFKQVEAAAKLQTGAGTGLLVDAVEYHAAPDGRSAVFTGSMYDKLEGAAAGKICSVDLTSGAIAVRTFGSGNDRLPRFSPDGRAIAFLSDRAGPPGNFQVHLLDTATWRVRAATRAEGFVEWLEWSADGTRILIGVAGLAADLAGAQGGVNVALARDELPDWMPSVDVGASDDQWRRAWVLDVATGSVAVASPPNLNVWEAAWCGPNAIAAVASRSPDEASWYRSTVERFAIDGPSQTLHVPQHHLGWIACNPSGDQVAIVEAICSDRTVVAGDVVLLRNGAEPVRLAAEGVDVSHLRFTSEHALAFAGHRSFETVVGTLDTRLRSCELLWKDSQRTMASLRYPELAPLPGGREFVTTLEGFAEQPCIAILGSATRELARIGSDVLGSQVPEMLGEVREAKWKAPDGLEIHGWLLVPPSRGPVPLVMEIHGGPVWQWRTKWLGASLIRRMFLERGYAVFLPNPRGSSGRGQDYAGRVFGDMGGADTGDYLSGLDHLVREGVADARNLFVTGGSYGGFMSSWLITQDDRFAAAAPVAPVTDWYSEHMVCHIPHFCRLFLADEMLEPGSKYFTRSPVFHAHKTRTPTLSIAGALDRNTPPNQAVEFHHRLLEHGVKSVLVVYPKEGHGCRNYPAVIDFTTRVVEWFEQHRKTG